MGYPSEARVRLRVAMEDGWVYAFTLDRDDVFVVDHHDEDGNEVRTSFDAEAWTKAEAKTTYTGADAVLCYALNKTGKRLRDFSHPEDNTGWGDLDTPDEDEDDD